MALQAILSPTQNMSVVGWEGVGELAQGYDWITLVWFGLLGVNASATARVTGHIKAVMMINGDVISVLLVEETRVPGGDHQPYSK